jgi:DNA-binding CsgD family transcriptional regulator
MSDNYTKQIKNEILKWRRRDKLVKDVEVKVLNDASMQRALFKAVVRRRRAFRNLLRSKYGYDIVSQRFVRSQPPEEKALMLVPGFVTAMDAFYRSQKQFTDALSTYREALSSELPEQEARRLAAEAVFTVERDWPPLPMSKIVANEEIGKAQSDKDLLSLAGWVRRQIRLDLNKRLAKAVEGGNTGKGDAEKNLLQQLPGAILIAMSKREPEEVIAESAERLVSRTTGIIEQEGAISFGESDQLFDNVPGVENWGRHRIVKRRLKDKEHLDDKEEAEPENVVHSGYKTKKGALTPPRFVEEFFRREEAGREIVSLVEHAGLSPREAEVLSLLLENPYITGEELAAHLAVDAASVYTFRHRIKAKMKRARSKFYTRQK